MQGAQPGMRGWREQGEGAEPKAEIQADGREVVVLKGKSKALLGLGGEKTARIILFLSKLFYFSVSWEITATFSAFQPLLGVLCEILSQLLLLSTAANSHPVNPQQRCVPAGFAKSQFYRK